MLSVDIEDVSATRLHGRHRPGRPFMHQQPSTRNYFAILRLRKPPPVYSTLKPTRELRQKHFRHLIKGRRVSATHILKHRPPVMRDNRSIIDRRQTNRDAVI
jgi:hypothetical protein